MIVLGETEVVVDGLTLPECPRWHDGSLYFSDIKEGRVFRLGADDTSELVAEFPGEHAGGIGFLSNGDLAVVLQHGRTVQRVADVGVSLHSDLTSLTEFGVNDMIMGRDFAYVSQPGFDIWGAGAHHGPKPTDLLIVRPDGSAAIAARGLASPNGLAISATEDRLFVSESAAMLVSSFRIEEDGRLSDRTVFAKLPQGGVPDGICLDVDGAIWAAVPVALEGPPNGLGVVRLDRQGRATHMIPPSGHERRALACAFGGTDRDTLYICTVADISGEQGFARGAGRLERVRLSHRGAGLP